MSDTEIQLEIDTDQFPSFLMPLLLFQPYLQRHVFILWREVAIAVGSVAQKLTANGVAFFEEVWTDGGVVFGADPAIPIPVEQGLPRDRRMVV